MTFVLSQIHFTKQSLCKSVSGGGRGGWMGKTNAGRSDHVQIEAKDNSEVLYLNTNFKVE